MEYFWRFCSHQVLPFAVTEYATLPLNPTHHAIQTATTTSLTVTIVRQHPSVLAGTAFIHTAVQILIIAVTAIVTQITSPMIHAILTARITDLTEPPVHIIPSV